MNTALIWGAGGGVGRALVEALASEGWTVYAVARRPEKLLNLTSHVFEADVSHPFAVQQATMAMEQEAVAAALWIYAVGDITSLRVGEMKPDDWQRILDADLNGAYLATHYSLPLLTQDAHLFFLGAKSERLRLPGLSAYAAAKAGLEAFTDVLRKEERNRRVTLVRPTAVATSLWQKVPFRMPAGALQPEEAARRILEAYRRGHQGVLDL